MKDNQFLEGTIELDSNEPHVNIQCPLCNRVWMKKVELNTPLVTPCDCKIKYSLRGTTEKVTVEMELNPEQTKIFKTKFQ